MGIVSIRIPQIGEGLQEARVVGFLKNPGDRMTRDEPIYQMETDKAVMDVESPVDGVLVKWLVAPDDIVAIGAEIARVESESAVPEANQTAPQIDVSVAETRPTRAVMPPRTRAYATEKGLTEAQLEALATQYEKVMPSHIDEFLAEKPRRRSFTDSPVSGKQRILNSRLQRGAQVVVPGTIMIAVDWGGIDREKARLKKSNEELRPTSFSLFAFCVALAVKSHPKFRTALVGDDVFRTYEKLSLGIAVSLTGDELALAVIEGADQLSWPEFLEGYRIAIDRARDGHDQAHEAVTISLTNMQSYGLRDAVPVVVPPAAATLFLGECYLAAHEEKSEITTRRTCNLALTFDHRVLNGVGAAQFMAEIRENVENVERLMSI